MISKIHRDGLERVKVDDAATLGDLYQATAEQLGIPQDDMVFSLSPSLVRGDWRFWKGSVNVFESQGWQPPCGRQPRHCVTLP